MIHVSIILFIKKEGGGRKGRREEGRRKEGCKRRGSGEKEREREVLVAQAEE